MAHLCNHPFRCRLESRGLSAGTCDPGDSWSRRPSFRFHSVNRSAEDVPPARRMSMPVLMDARAHRARADAHRPRDRRAQPRRRRAGAGRHPHAGRAAGRAAARRTLREITGVDVPIGALDITLYRDDLMRHAGRAAAGRAPHRDPVLDRRPEDPARGRRALHRPDDPRGARRADRLRPAPRDPARGAGRPRPPRAADQGRLRRQERADVAAESVRVRLQETDGQRRGAHRKGRRTE